MLKKHALERYYKSLVRPRRIINFIVRWDPSLTIKENATRLKIVPTNAARIATVFKLKSATSIRAEHARYFKRSLKMSQLRKNNVSYKDIGTIYGITRQRVEQIVKQFNKK